MTKRSPRADSATAAIRAAQNAARGLPVIPAHVHVRNNDRPFLEGVLRSRALDEWTPADLVVAVQLARCQNDIEEEAKLLAVEGTVVHGKLNPRAQVVEAMTRRMQAFMRALRMGGRAVGDPRDLLGRRKLERQAVAIHEQLSRDGDDGLLAV